MEATAPPREARITTSQGPWRAARRLALVVVVLSACVGLPPSPPQQDGGSVVDGTAGNGTTGNGTTGNGTVADSTAGSIGDTETGGVGPVCGDGIVEDPEGCDLGQFNGSGKYCTDDCTTNVCGDGYVGPGEACDDGNQSDEDLCTTNCGPTSCGDGVIQGGEQCDEGEGNSETGACLPSCVMASCGDQFVYEGVEVCDSDEIGRESCQTQGFSGGVLLCGADCTMYDTDNCYACGDADLDPGEQCDGAQLDGEDCISQGFDDGTLACSASCTFDASGCVSFACGNGVIDGADQCDGAQLGGATCINQGFEGGTISCSAGCALDTTGCYECGDGAVDPAEECDGANLGGNDCGDLGMAGTPSGGTPACNATCELITGSCTFCGDGLRQGTEACDGAQLGGATCADFAGAGETASGGTPACNAACMLIEGTCTFCGDGVRQGTEQCDGAQLGGATCASVEGAGHGGALSCEANCTYDTSACCLNAGQLCFGMNALCCDGACNVSGGTQC